MRFTLFLLLLIPMLSIAQANRFQVGVEFSSDLYLNQSDLELSGFHGYSYEEPSFNYSARVLGTYQFAPRLELGLGIGYSQKDYRGTYYCHVCDLVFQHPQNIRFRYLEVPVSIQYTIIDGTWDWFAGAGLNYGLATQGTYTRSSSFTSGPQNLLSPFVSSGLQRPVGDRFNLRMRLAYQHSVEVGTPTLPFSFQATQAFGGIFYRI